MAKTVSLRTERQTFIALSSYMRWEELWSMDSVNCDGIQSQCCRMSQRWWWWRFGGLFMKLLVVKSKLSKKGWDGEIGDGENWIGKAPHCVQGEGQNGAEEIRFARSGTLFIVANGRREKNAIRIFLTKTCLVFPAYPVELLQHTHTHTHTLQAQITRVNYRNLFSPIWL